MLILQEMEKCIEVIAIEDSGLPFVSKWKRKMGTMPSALFLQQDETPKLFTHGFQVTILPFDSKPVCMIYLEL